LKAAVLALGVALGIPGWGGVASSQDGTAGYHWPNGSSPAGHQVHFEGITFTCVKGGSLGQERFILSSPEAKYIPKAEPAPGDPLRQSWLIVYRIICEREGEAQTKTSASR
jgi:hypothetical protein